MKYSVVVVDDHVLLSQAIGGLVEGFEQFKVLYTCKNGQELIDKFANPKNVPDIVLMDVNMPAQPHGDSLDERGCGAESVPR